MNASRLSRLRSALFSAGSFLRLAQQAASAALLWSLPLVVGHGREVTKGFNEEQRVLDNAGVATRTKPESPG
jgi:hypothetical protein